MSSVRSKENTRPAKRHKAVSVDGAPQSCPICLEVLDAASKKRIKLQCGHIFHRECVLNQRSRTCALCRVTISKNAWTDSGISVPPVVPPADEILEEQLIPDEEEHPYQMTPRDVAELTEIQRGIAEGRTPRWHLTRFWAQRREMGRQHARHRAGYGQ